jgi:predicted transcriptional regulator
MTSSRSPVSDSEREVLHVLWNQGPLTVRDVQAGLASRGLAWQ